MTGAPNDLEKMAKLQALLAAAAKGVVARGVKNVAIERFGLPTGVAGPLLVAIPLVQPSTKDGDQ